MNLIRAFNELIVLMNKNKNKKTQPFGDWALYPESENRPDGY
jgi:hypothetical protein